MRALLICTSIAIGCGGSGQVAPPDLMEASPTPTPSPSFPALPLPNHGGPVLDAMKVYTVVWPGDEAAGAEADSFTGWLLAQGAYWNSTAEYGVGRGQSLGVLVLPSPSPLPSPIPDTFISQTIESQIASGAWAAPDSQTVYSFILPYGAASTNDIPFPNGGCGGYIAYHQETRNTHQPYAVTLRCSGPHLDAYSFQLSHELVETASNPLPHVQPAWDFPKAPVGPDTENADMCYPLDIAESMGTDRLYLARFWSSQNAIGGLADPCVPNLKQPFFGVVMVPPVVALVGGEADATLMAFGDVPLPIHFELYSAARTDLKSTTGTLMSGDSIPVHFSGGGSVNIVSSNGGAPSPEIFWGVVQ